MIGLEQQIATQQLVGLAVEGLCDTVGEEAHAGQTRHPDDQRQGQQMKLAGTQIAQQHTKGKTEGGHGGSDRCGAGRFGERRR